MTLMVDGILETIRDLDIGGLLPDAVSIPNFDRVRGVGIGIDAEGCIALILPGEGSQTAFETLALKFDPWCDATLADGGEALQRCSILRCRVDLDDEPVSRLVIGLLLGIIDMQARFGEAGTAIWSLKGLFGDGFNVQTNANILRGLIGELLVIYAADDLGGAVNAWHINSDDRYDFSIDNRRLEVKTTKSAVREHRFNSRQLPPQANTKVWIASVKLAEVSVGESLSGLFDSIARRVTKAQAQKVAEIIAETTGLPPATILDPKFDLESSLNSLKIYQAESIPTPEMTAGTSDLKWTAFLSEDEGAPHQVLNEILTPVETI
jgi:hypothetical protein